MPDLPSFPEDHWEDLLDLIEQGKVLPILGNDAVSYGPADQPLLPTLARELARHLRLPDGSLPAHPSLSEVVQEHLKRNGERNPVYSRLQRILREPRFTPGTALRALAQIDGFRLFLTTTFDGLLAQALQEARHPAQVDSIAFWPGAVVKDLPCRANHLSTTTVFHLLGKASSMPGEYVAWEEDLLDFLFELPRHLGTDSMRHLSADLRSHAVLTIGLGFSDWITRLLLRITRQEPLSRLSLHSWLAEGPPDSVPRSMVMFFGGVSRNIQVVECEPARFASELARRWRSRHPVSSNRAVDERSQSTAHVFLSYAREDEAAARRIKHTLEEHGVDVYYDRERLGPGINFHHELEDQVRRHCSVFLSVVSPTTEAAHGDNYYRRERFWASSRGEAWSDKERERFYLPLLIHETPPLTIEQEPRLFAGAQWNHCPAGAVDDILAGRIAQLQRDYRRSRQ